MKSLAACLAALILGLTGCSPSPVVAPPEGANIVTVIGAIHGQHRESEDYSLDVLRDAIVKYDPDIVMVELPADRFATASANFDKYGEVRESRADDFPELTDVVFPLRSQLGFEMLPVAAWTREIADERRAVETRLAADPARADDWLEYQAAIQRYRKALAARSDDPGFIHSSAYDAAVKDRQETYERLFGADLGAGGWRAINAAHLDKINSALDILRGQEKRILILFGAGHKYMIMEGLEAREDVFLIDAAPLFGQ
ncbi:hypothetical protein [Parasphingorhabdus sp.]|uniref:hypothetical protein n=1 Tax=Parasphingorhabdus sp. TaxID=2709688 RepID=UPI003C76D253